MDNWNIIIERSGVQDAPVVLSAENLDAALALAVERAAEDIVLSVSRVEQPSEPIALLDGAIVTSTTGVRWQLVAVGSTTPKWVKVV